jgi:hypothetical protein
MEAAYDNIVNRAPNGQFTRRDNPRLPDESALRNHESPAAEKPQAEQTELGEPIKMPQAWGKALGTYWHDLPYPVQQEFFRREDEIQKFVSENGRVLKQAEESQRELGEIAERYADVLKTADGRPVPVPQVLDQLLAAHKALESDPRQALLWLHNYYKVDPAELAAEIAQRNIDPVAQAREQERAAWQAELQRRDAEIQAQIQQQQQQQWAAYTQQLEQRIQQFADDKPYWAKVEDSILYHVAALKRTNPNLSPLEILQMAHDKAVAGTEYDEKSKSKAAAELAERKQRAAQAKRLASMNVGTSKVGVSPVRQHNISQGRGLENYMGELWDRINS